MDKFIQKQDSELCDFKSYTTIIEKDNNEMSEIIQEQNKNYVMLNKN